MTRIHYAPGLYIDYTQKELDKLKAIKAHPNRNGRPRIEIPWDEDVHRDILRLELKLKRIAAISLLDECGIDTTIIADLFGIKKQQVQAIVRNKSTGRGL